MSLFLGRGRIDTSVLILSPTTDHAGDYNLLLDGDAQGGVAESHVPTTGTWGTLDGGGM